MRVIRKVLQQSVHPNQPDLYMPEPVSCLSFPVGESEHDRLILTFEACYLSNDRKFRAIVLGGGMFPAYIVSSIRLTDDDGASTSSEVQFLFGCMLIVSDIEVA